MKKFIGILLILVLLMGQIPLISAKGEGSEGKWVLESVEDTEQEDFNTSDSESGDGWFYETESATNFHYQPSNFAMDWYSEERTEEGTQRGEGTLKASFSELPESFESNKLQGITVDLSSTLLLTNVEDTGYDPDMSATATISCSQYIFDDGNSNKISYEIPLYPTSDYSFSEILTFIAPSEASYLYFDVVLSVPYVGELATSYTYKWVGNEQKESKEINLSGLVLSAEAKPMPWMKLTAEVYYGTENYTEKQPDMVIEGETDHKGRYSLKIPVTEDNEGTVGIMLKGTMTCVYPYEEDKEVFYFVDMKDSKSKDSNQISLSSWITVDPENDQAVDGKISVYRLLAFYNLGLDAWSIDMAMDTAGPDPLYLYSNDGEEKELLQNYSTLYTAAFDAWFFGAAVLDEKESLLNNKIRIEVRWPLTEDITCSHFAPGDLCIRLEDGDSKRDDNSRFTILHELGHAFDYITNGEIYRAYAQPSDENVNHGGYFNSSTSDSYVEGFATFFAGTVQLYSGYKNPQVLSWIDLGKPEQYSIWEVNGSYEELAIASLLYKGNFLINNVEKYWDLLDQDRSNFYEYYKAISEYLKDNSSNGAEEFDNQAYVTGLFKMPFGNGVYDLGEPFKDTNNNGSWDNGEIFGDLMYDVDSDGVIDRTKTLQEIEKSDLIMGQSSDALRNRDIVNTIQPEENSYIYISGEEVDYVLVDILPEGEEGTRCLMSVSDNRVVIGLPTETKSGKVEISIPGGGTVFEWELSELQQVFKDTMGQKTPLDEINISEYDLPYGDMQVNATYGNIDEDGIFTAPEITQEELIKSAEDYVSGGVSIDQVIEDLADRAEDIIEEEPNNDNIDSVIDNEEDIQDEVGNDDKSNTKKETDSSSVLFIIGVVFIVCAILISIISIYFNHRKNKKLKNVNMQQRYCNRCGHMIFSGNIFCTNCGAPQQESPKTEKKTSKTLFVGIFMGMIIMIVGVILIYLGSIN